MYVCTLKSTSEALYSVLVLIISPFKFLFIKTHHSQKLSKFNQLRIFYTLKTLSLFQIFLCRCGSSLFSSPSLSFVCLVLSMSLSTHSQGMLSSFVCLFLNSNFISFIGGYFLSTCVMLFIFILDFLEKISSIFTQYGKVT